MGSEDVRGATKERARRLVDELIASSAQGDRRAARRRCLAAMGLVSIMRNELKGEEIVAWRFVKNASRREQGIQALLRLSDDELGGFAYDAVGPVSSQINSTKLLGTVLKHTDEAQLLRTTISNALKSGETGAAAIFHLAATVPDSFCAIVDDQALLSFCKRIIVSGGGISPRWYYGAKLFCLFIMHKPSPWPSDEELVTELLSAICKVLVQETMLALYRDVAPKSVMDFCLSCSSLLPLIAACCRTIADNGWWSEVHLQDTMTVLARMLITSLHSKRGGFIRFNALQAYTLSILFSLVESRSIFRAIPDTSLFDLGAILMKTLLKTAIFDIRSPDLFEKVSPMLTIHDASH